jgi:hypothetical protein
LALKQDIKIQIYSHQMFIFWLLTRTKYRKWVIFTSFFWFELRLMKPLPKSLHFGIAKSSENYVVAMPKI